MKIWSMKQISSEERRNILEQHKEFYDGYRTLKLSSTNKQPLNIEDFAKDKGGITVNNKGKVKTYTNYNINEKEEKDLCEQCGGVMNENMCEQCGWKSGETTETSVVEKKGKLSDIHNVSDLDDKSKFDYTEEEVKEQDVSGSRGIYGDMKPAYDFDSEGPGKGGPYQRSSTPTGYSEGEDYKKEFKKIQREENIQESYNQSGDRIKTMMKRMNIL